jgi:hypothetical protein
MPSMRYLWLSGAGLGDTEDAKMRRLATEQPALRRLATLVAGILLSV